MLGCSYTLGVSLRDNPSHGDGPEARSAARINLFMAATLHASGAETSVKIRDLSANGAQIEGAAVAVGSAVTLARGALRVAGSVTWCSESRCGLRFASPVSVHDWMANPVNREQRRVDTIVTAIKTGAALAPAAVPAGVPARSADGDEVVIGGVARLIESLGDALASDPDVVIKHGIALQNLDIALQTLTTLLETMRDGADHAASRARLGELRASCAQALGGG